MNTEKVVTFNENTGEVINNKYIGDGDTVKTTIISKKQKEYVDSHVLRFNKGTPFGKLYVGGMMKHIEEELKPAEWMFFCRLLDFVCYDDCILRPYGDRRFKAFNSIQEISNALGDKDYKTCSRYLNKLYKKEVIITISTGDNDTKIMRYVCNPYIFFRGSDLLDTIAKEFLDSRWAKYNNEICSTFDEVKVEDIRVTK